MTPKEKLAYDYLEVKINEVNEKLGVVQREITKLRNELDKKRAEAIELSNEFNKLFDLQKKMREKLALKKKQNRFTFT
jgi:uncharacterized small protein (DUF1192 family)